MVEGRKTAEEGEGEKRKRKGKEKGGDSERNR